MSFPSAAILAAACLLWVGTDTKSPSAGTASLFPSHLRLQSAECPPQTQFRAPPTNLFSIKFKVRGVLDDREDDEWARFEPVAWSTVGPLAVPQGCGAARAPVGFLANSLQRLLC